MPYYSQFALNRTARSFGGKRSSKFPTKLTFFTLTIWMHRGDKLFKYDNVPLISCCHVIYYHAILGGLQ